MDVVVEQSGIERIKEMNKRLINAQSVLEPLYSAMYKDFRFYLGDQWEAADVSEAKRRKIPMLTINRIAKMVNVVVGSILQNKLDVKVMPIEAEDSLMSEVLGRTVKWITSQSSFQSRWGEATKDGCIGGLGWVFVGMDFEKDPLNGDIEITKYSPFEVVFDPDTSQFDLSDCNEIFVHKVIKRERLQSLYPKFRKDIEKVVGTNPAGKFFKEYNKQYTSDEDSVDVVEYWYRKYENQVFMIAEESDDGIIYFDGDEKEREVLEARGVKFVEKGVGKIFLTIYAGDSLILFDGENPLGLRRFPFVPFAAFHASSFDNWEVKLQGITRILVDLQREHNKRRSSLMQAVLKMPSSGFMFEEGALKDESILDEIGGRGGVKMKVRQGRKFPVQLEPQQIPHAILMLDNLMKDDMTAVSISPDLLGDILERGASGVSIQLRQRQGIMAFQEIYSNNSDAFKSIGLLIVELMIRFFSPEKIMRILGTDYPIRQEIKMLVEQREALKKQLGAMIGESADVQSPDEDEMADKLIQNEQIRQQMEVAFKGIEDQIQVLQAKDAEFWLRYETLKDTLRFDIVIDEQINSPTYRHSALMQIQNVMQSGGDLVPFDAVIELMDVPETIKEKMRIYAKQKEEAAMMMHQTEMAQREKRTQAMEND